VHRLQVMFGGLDVWRLGSRFQSVRAHERALAALKDISERAPFAAEPERDDTEAVRAVQVLDDRALSRHARHDTAPGVDVTEPRARAAKQDRPTIASIPTVGWRPARPADPGPGTETPA